MCIWGGRAVAHVWKSEENVWQLVLSFQPCRSQVLNSSHQALHGSTLPTEPSRQPYFQFIKFLKIFLFHFTCVSVLTVSMYVYLVHAWCPWRPEENNGCPRTGVMRVLGHHTYGVWEANLGPLQMQRMPLTPELSLQSLFFILTAQNIGSTVSLWFL